MHSDLTATLALQQRKFRHQAPRMAVLCGPASPEDLAYFKSTPHNLRSYQDLRQALKLLGAKQVDLIDITESAQWFEFLYDVDLAIINLHGEPGEDGAVQGLLRLHGIPFVGSDVEASVVALNKSLSKLIAVSAGIRTPDFFTLIDGTAAHRGSPAPTGELICKPLRGGSSIGTFRLSPQEACPSRGEWIVEKFLPGDDVTVTVVENSGRPVALPAIALQHGGDFYGEEGKLGSQSRLKAVATRPANLLTVLDECQTMAVEIHRLVGARHISRSDFVVHHGRPYLLEINTAPGVSRISNSAECAYAAGLSYEEFIALVVGPAIGELPG